MIQNADNIARMAHTAAAQQKQCMDTINTMQAEYSRSCERISHAIDEALTALTRLVAEELFKLMAKNGFDPSKLTPDRYMSAREASIMIGMPLHTLYKKVAEIPHTKKGKRLVFSESSLRQYIENM